MTEPAPESGDETAVVKKPSVFSDTLQEILGTISRAQNNSAAPEVGETPELLRVEALPRREDYVSDAHIILTRAFARNPQKCAEWAVLCWLAGREASKPPSPKGVMVISPAQAQPLCDLYDHGGAVAALKVGEGKTPITFLAPAIVQADCAILLVKGGLIKKTKRDFATLVEAFTAEPNHFVVSYQELALEANADLLTRLGTRPDGTPFERVVIIADECQALRNKKNAATRRVARFAHSRAEEHHAIYLMLLSGTIFEGRGIAEYHHILKWALGVHKMPLPATQAEAALWGRALDEEVSASESRLELGALKRFVDKTALDRRESVRKWLGRRIRQTPGVTVTDSPDSPASLLFSKWKPRLDAKIIRALRDAQEMRLPDGDDIDSDEDQLRSLTQLPWGFYMKWKKPAPEHWRTARKEWYRYFRFVKNGGMLDTEFQIRKAVREGKMGVVPEYDAWYGRPAETDPAGNIVIPAQRGIIGDFEIETEVEWISDCVLNQILDQYGTDHIIWTHYRAIGFALEARGLQFFHQKGLSDQRGPDGKPLFIEDAPGGAGARSIVASISAVREGMNLQYKWCKNLVCAAVGNHEIAEQFIGRTHRRGQVEDTVEVVFATPSEFYTHALEAAKVKAVAATHISGDQKLASGDWV